MLRRKVAFIDAKMIIVRGKRGGDRFDAKNPTREVVLQSMT